MNLYLETINFEKFDALENFIRSLAQKRFASLEFISSIHVNMKKTDDPRIPWTSELELRPVEGEVLFAEAHSANYISAFSQSVVRMERQVEKYMEKHFRSRA